MAFQTYGQSGGLFFQAPQSQTPSSFPHGPGPARGQLGASPPRQMDTSSSYLPPFLLGSPAPKSPSRSRPSGPVSSGLTPGFHQGMRIASGTPGGTSLMERSHMHVGGGLGSSKVEPRKTAGGPPVQSLYNHATSPARTSTPLVPGATPERRQLNFSAMNAAQWTVGGVGRVGPVGGTPGTMRPRSGSTPGTIGSLDMSVTGAKQRSPPSPAQMDPFYTQGENLTSEDDYHDCWVTIFGFPPAASSYILEQFSQYGTVAKHVVTSGGNWMHILYQSRLQAKKALSKNGKVYGNGIMVGVQPCIDKSVMEGYAPSLPSSSASLTTASTPGKKPTSIRPLTAAYQASSSVHQVAPSNPNTPQKSTGFFSKALEYMFGW